MQSVPPGNPRKPRRPELVTSYTSPMPSTALGAGPSSSPPQVSKPPANDLAAKLPLRCPERQVQSPAEHSKHARDLVELRRLELRTSCMPCTLQLSPHVAARGPVWRSPAASVAGHGLASPGAGPRWLPNWLPEFVGAANLLAARVLDHGIHQPPAGSAFVRQPCRATSLKRYRLPAIDRAVSALG